MPDPDRVQRSRLDFARQVSAPAAPATGAERFYVDAAGALRQKSADGTDAAAGGGGIAQQDIDDAIAAVIAGAPSGLNTLDEIAAALGDDASFASTVATALAGKQPVDADLTAIAALSTTAFGRSLLALADAAALRTSAGLGTAALAASGDFQPIDSDLTAIAALSTTSYGRALLALADAAAGRTALGLGTAAVQATGAFDAAGAAAAAQAASQPLDATLTAFAALAIASGKLPYGSGSDAFSLADLTAAGRALLDDADAAAQLTTLGVSTYIKTLLDDADAAAARATLGLDFAAVRAASSADTVCANGTWTAIAMAAADSYDPKGLHDPVTNNSRITAVASGYFRVFTTFSWRNSTNAATRYGQIYKNGAGYGPTHGLSHGTASDNVPSHVLVDIIPVVATDYIQFMAYQETGGNLNAYAIIAAVEFVPA